MRAFQRAIYEYYPIPSSTIASCVKMVVSYDKAIILGGLWLQRRDKRKIFTFGPFCTFLTRVAIEQHQGDLNEPNLGLTRPGCLGTNQLRVLRADLGV